jgi:chromosomal replication initiator protein
MGDSVVSCTFDTFVAGVGNLDALRAAHNLIGAESPDPLLVLGARGLGKTHLLRAIANQAVLLGHEHVTYATGVDVLTEYEGALRFGGLAELTQSHESSSVLCIDDVDAFKGNETVQAVLARVLAVALDNGARVALSATTLPVDCFVDPLETLLKRFTSVTIEDSGAAWREGVLRHHAKALGGHLDDYELASIVAHNPEADGHRLQRLAADVIRGKHMAG